MDLAKIWIDILTPKQALFFKPLIKQLIDRNDLVLITTRKYPQATEMLEQLGMSAKVIGRYGGRELKEKLRADSERILELVDPVTSFHPDLALSFVSPTATRVAFGVGIPMICVSDSPHSRAVSALTIPLAHRLISPDLINRKKWTRYGIDSKHIIQYHAVDQMAWTKNMTPSRNVITQLNLQTDRPIVTIRIEESSAAYLLDRTEKDFSPIIPIVQELLRRYSKYQFVVLPRYPHQHKMLKQALPSEVVVPNHIIDGLSLLSYSALFIGAGGTMTTEAVLLGIPAISFYNGTLDVEEWLQKRKLLFKATSVNEVIALSSQILSNLANYQKRAKENADHLQMEFEDPIPVILSVIDEVLSLK